VTPGTPGASEHGWDSVVTARALLMTVAVAGLEVSAAAR